MTSVFSKSAVSSSTAGLNKRPTYEELISYIREDPDTIRYPNRDATLAANSFAMNQMVGEGFRQLSQMTTNVQDQVKSDALLRSYAGSSGMDVGKLKTLLNSYGLKPVEAPMGSNSSILKELPDFMKKFNISTNRTSTANGTTEPPPVSEMKEDYSSGPNRTAGGMTNSTFTPDSGPMKKEAEGPVVKRLRGSSPVPPVMSDEDLAVRDESTLSYISSHPEMLFMGLGMAALAAGAAPVTMGVAAAELAGAVGTNLIAAGATQIAGRAAGTAMEAVIPGSGGIMDLGVQVGAGAAMGGGWLAALNRGGAMVLRRAMTAGELGQPLLNGVQREMALEEAYRTFEAPGTYNPGEIHEGPYRRLETLNGEVRPAAQDVVRFDDTREQLHPNQLRQRRPLEEVVRENPIDRGGGAMGMFNEEELQLLNGRPFHGDIIHRLYNHIYPQHAVTMVRRAMGDAAGQIAFQLDPRAFAGRVQRARELFNVGAEARQADIIAGTRDEALIREQYIQAARDAGASVVRQGIAAFQSPMNPMNLARRAARAGLDRIIQREVAAPQPAAAGQQLLRQVMPPQVPAAPANTQYLNDLIRARNAMMNMNRRPITEAEAALFQRADIPANTRLLNRAIQEQYQIFGEYGHERAHVDFMRTMLPEFGHRGPGAFPRGQ